MERILSVTISLILFLYAVEVVSFAFGHPLCSSHDALALLQFKHSRVVADYPFRSSDHYYDDLFHCQSSAPKMTSWNRSSMDCCTWNGVTCDSLTGNVIGLDLSCGKLEGTIHPNSSLFQLHYLQKIDLSINNFLGSQIPPSIGQLASLMHLNLSYCLFEGRIPLEISQLSKLVSLDLSDIPAYFKSDILNKSDSSSVVQYFSREGFNMLFQNLTKLEVLSLNYVNISSNIPMNVSFSSSLRYLDLGYTNLQGDLPKSIFLLPNLETLNLKENDLAISLPKFNWSSSHTLTELYLCNNNISGALPSSLGSLKALKLLDFSGCYLVGPIPESVRNLSQITQLYLLDNHLESKIPDAFSNLQKLTYLQLEDNNFTGPFPSSLVNLTKLEILRLRYNSLSGPLPFTANGLQNLRELDLSENSLNGSIPSWMLSLPSLSDLDLGSNHFSGPIPEFKTNSIEELLMYENQLSGPIPHSLRDLVKLTYLSLGSNNLSGEVEVEMFSTMKKLEGIYLSHSGLSWSSNKENITFPSLKLLSLGFCHVKDFSSFLLNSKQLRYLDLSENEIHGQLPKWFGGLSSLEVFNLSHNYLTSLDHLPWKALRVVDLQSNSLRGPLPSSLCKPNSLYTLILSHNNLSGEIPNCLFISPTLSILELRGNNLHGPIPNIFSGCGWLNYIGLSKNQLEGPIPRSLVNCTSLQVLDLGRNKIHDTFPIWLERLHELEVLILKSNRFYGSISAFQSKLPFPNLTIFDLSENSFTGSLPTEVLKGFKAMMNMDAHKSTLEYMEELGGHNLTYKFSYKESVILVMKNQETELKRIPKIFTTIDLSRNKFVGEIPRFIGNLNSLLLLNLSHNNLTGHIPVEMKNMSTLEALDLSFNQLTGKIPEEVASLTFLAVLNLSHNHLVGPIPHGNQFNTFLNDSYVGNSDLCGFPLSNECGQHNSPPALVDQEEDEPTFLSDMTWQSVLIGYGCGLVFGFSILYLIYHFERPRWFIDFFATITHEMTYRVKRRSQRRRNFRRRR